MEMKKSLRFNFLIFFMYRLSSVLLVHTFYAPDEYWQSLEIAHRMAFGYGYLTWEWKEGIRSYFYPFIFYIFYKSLDIFNLDFPIVIITLPKILQALLTSISDVYFLKLSRTFLFEDFLSKAVIFSNWFWYYCGMRTILNTFETCLTIIGLYYYPWNFLNMDGKKKNYQKFPKGTYKNSYIYLTLAAINCMTRPTAITIWGPLVFFHLLFLNSNDALSFCLKCILPVSSAVLIIFTLIDYLWYGKFVFPILNFFVFNLYKGISSFYGTHSFYWYLIQGLPVILGFHYLPFICGLILFFTKDCLAATKFKKVFGIIIFIVLINILLLSSIAHKEFRFALPLTPLIMLIALKFKSKYFKTFYRKFQIIWISLLCLNFLVPTVLISCFHQRGPLKLMEYLRNEVSDCNDNCSFLFLMPCHSTPLYSHLHVNISTRFLTCEPPISENYFDESEYFFNDSQKWLSEYWLANKPPSHIAFFDSIENSVKLFLNKKKYLKEIEILHTIFAGKGFGKYIVVYKPNR